MSSYLAWSPLDGIKDIINRDIIPLVASPTPTTFIDPHLLINPAIDFEVIPLISGVPTNTPIPPPPTPSPISPTNTPASPSPTSSSQVSPTVTLSTSPSPSPFSTKIPSPDTSTSTESTPSSPQTIVVNSNNFLVGAIVVLFLIILFLVWPKIKSWLHKKTE